MNENVDKSIANGNLALSWKIIKLCGINKDKLIWKQYLLNICAVCQILKNN